MSLSTIKSAFRNRLKVQSGRGGAIGHKNDALKGAFLNPSLSRCVCVCVAMVPIPTPPSPRHHQFIKNRYIGHLTCLLHLESTMPIKVTQ